MPMLSRYGPVTLRERPMRMLYVEFAPAAAGTMRHEQVVPAVVIDGHRRFRIDRDVHRRLLRIAAFAGFRVELDQAGCSRSKSRK